MDRAGDASIVCTSNSIAGPHPASSRRGTRRNMALLTPLGGSCTPRPQRTAPEIGPLGGLDHCCFDGASIQVDLVDEEVASPTADLPQCDSGDVVPVDRHSSTQYCGDEPGRW